MTRADIQRAPTSGSRVLQILESNLESFFALGRVITKRMKTMRVNDNDESKDKEKNDEGMEDEMENNFRISLLWHSKTRTSTLEDGSKAFGRLLRRVCDFSLQLAKLDDAQNKSNYDHKEDTRI